MFRDLFPLFPEQASSIASDVDLLYLYLIAISGFFTVLIFGLIFIFALKYRRRSEEEVPRPNYGSLRLEVLWSVIPLLIVVTMFVWGARVFFTISRAPDDAMDIYVVARQWMWKFQHPEGNREINELHVPLGRPVKLTMTSEDVIHSFYVPAFRVKQDVLPGRYTTVWFEATEPGRYHLFCAEYCGAQHAGMRGSIVVLEPGAYEAWLTGGAAEGSMADRGERLFNQLGCVTCHVADGSGRCPSLVGLYDQPVVLTTGQTVIADEEYLRESILQPNARIVMGYQPIMPTYQGQVSEEGLLQLIAYIRSLAQNDQAAGNTGIQP
jgi:cytochrome c oxidase subunit II